MTSTTLSIIVGSVSSLLSAVIAVVISNRYYRRFENRKMKLDTFRRLSANRFDVQGDEFSRAINEIHLVYQDCPRVISAIDEYHKHLSDANSLQFLASVFKEASKVLGFKFDGLSDDFLLAPFNTRPSSADQGSTGKMERRDPGVD